MDDLFGILIGFAIIAIVAVAAIYAVAMVSIFMLPAVAVGGGVLYYINNIHLPEKRRKETRQRVEVLYDRAMKLTPPDTQLRDALRDAGIFSPALQEIAMVLFAQEGLKPPSLPPLGDDPIAAGRYQDELQRYMNAARPERYQEFEQRLIWALSEFEPERDEGGMFTASRQRTRKEVEEMILRFINDDGLFKSLVDQLNENYDEESEVMPSKSKHDDYAWRYLKNTPLLALERVDGRISIRDRMYHTYLLGSSGSGKTNLIENIIAHDLKSDEDCCVVVIDSQTQLCEKLAELDVPDTTYITPKFDLALNLFDVGYEKMKGRGIEGETLINKTVGLLSFVMEGMMGAEFTAPQRTIFQYAIQLVISIPGGNIFTFMEVLSDDGHLNYVDEIAQFDANTRRFFSTDFGSAEYKRSREAIRRRLDSLLLNPTFRRLFSATENRIDMRDQLATKNLILIDTNKPMLDDVASAFFGRLFIAMILRASHMRFDGGRFMRPVYLIVDEAHEYFDRSISDMLEQARKANIGLIVAHQSLSQAKGRDGGNIADPLMVNTATKIIWTAYRDDALKFAGSMQIKADEILALPQFTFGMYSRKTGFAPIRGVPDALSVVPKREDRQQLQREMEALYGPSKQASGGTHPDIDPMDNGKDKDGATSGEEPDDNGQDKRKKPPPPDVDMI